MIVDIRKTYQRPVQLQVILERPTIDLSNNSSYKKDLPKTNSITGDIRKTIDMSNNR